MSLSLETVVILLVEFADERWMGRSNHRLLVQAPEDYCTAYHRVDRPVEYNVRESGRSCLHVERCLPLGYEVLLQIRQNQRQCVIKPSGSFIPQHSSYNVTCVTPEYYCTPSR